jgi:hypothetical protein
MSLVLSVADVVMRLLCGILTLPAVAGMMRNYSVDVV